MSELQISAGTVTMQATLPPKPLEYVFVQQNGMWRLYADEFTFNLAEFWYQNDEHKLRNQGKK